MSLVFSSTWAQFSIENSWKVGEHNASSGTYLKTQVSGYYYHKEFSANSQVQIDVINAQERIFSGFMIDATRDSIFQKFPISISTQYLFLPFSESLRESNFSLIAEGNNKGFSYALGLNFRTYAYTQYAIETYDIEQQRLHENWGLMYQLGYTYTPHRDSWDIGLFITNWDDFLINQDMNPFMRLIAQYHFDSNINLYTEANYIKSGTFNGSSNFFGYYIKTGIIWLVN